MGTSGPTNFEHKVHVGFDPITGAFTVRKEVWREREGERVTDRIGTP